MITADHETSGLTQDGVCVIRVSLPVSATETNNQLYSLWF